MPLLPRLLLWSLVISAASIRAQQVPDPQPDLQLQILDSSGFQYVAGQVMATVVQPDGKVVVGGRFTRLASGVGRTYLLRLNADGSLDAGFTPTISTIAGPARVAALHWANDSLYVGGVFDRVNGMTSPNLVRLDVDGNLAPGWNSPFASMSQDNPVQAIAATSTSLFIGGDLAVNGAFGLARLHPITGNWDLSWVAQTQDGDLANPVGISSRGQARALAILGDDLLVGGTFRRIAGVDRHGIARISQTGPVVVRPFDARLSDSRYSVHALLVTPDAVYIGGNFVRETVPVIPFLNRLDPQTGAFDANWIPGISGTVFALERVDGHIYIGGDFFGGGPISGNRLFRASISTGAIDPGWTHVFNTTVASLSHDCRQRLIVGGSFTTAAGLPRNGLAGYTVGGGECLFRNGFDSVP